jgi:hypothetical protein
MPKAGVCPTEHLQGQSTDARRERREQFPEFGCSYRRNGVANSRSEWERFFNA